MVSHACGVLRPSDQDIWLDQVDAAVASEGEEVTLMDWGNCIIRVRLCGCAPGRPSAATLPFRFLRCLAVPPLSQVMLQRRRQRSLCHSRQYTLLLSPLDVSHSCVE